MTSKVAEYQGQLNAAYANLSNVSRAIEAGELDITIEGYGEGLPSLDELVHGLAGAKLRAPASKQLTISEVLWGIAEHGGALQDTPRVLVCGIGSDDQAEDADLVKIDGEPDGRIALFVHLRREGRDLDV